MRAIMVIFAKGESVRIPEKNIQPFCGLPLVCWPVIQGMTAKMVDRVIVSTNSEKVASIVRPYGAEVIFRRYVDLEDTSGTMAVHDAVDQLRDEVSDDDMLIWAWPPNCVWKPGDIDRAASKLIEMNRREGALMMCFTSPQRVMTVGVQVRPDRYDSLAGNANDKAHPIVMSKVLWDFGIAKRHLHPEKLCPAHHFGYFVPVETWQMHDVDTPEEWEFAELCMEHYLLKGRGADVYYDYASMENPVK